MLDWLLPYMAQAGATADQSFAPGANLPAPALQPEVAQLAPPSQPPSVSNPWEPVPIPQAHPPMPNMPEAGNYGGNPASNPNLQPIGTPANPADKLMATLRGIQVPKPPEPQKVSTPHAPVPRQIPSGQLLALLEGLNAARNSGAALHLPNSLGQALGGR